MVWRTIWLISRIIRKIVQSLLDNEKFGPENRPYRKMKEDRVSSRYPDLLRTLSKTRDPGQRKLLFESYMREMGGTIRDRQNRTGSDFLVNKGSCDVMRRLWIAENICDVLSVHVGTCETNYDVLCTCRGNIPQQFVGIVLEIQATGPFLSKSNQKTIKIYSKIP